jgi:D-glycero-D-manno-heptose 1,7-bisphosphate phosphatase
MSNLYKRGALFLDRDGVINIDNGYLHRKQDCIFIPNIFDLLVTAKKMELYIFVVTNQAGIARGYYSEVDFYDLSIWMNKQFLLHQGKVDEFFFCPHHPEFGRDGYKIDCDCRKPKSGLFEQAKQKYEIDLNNSFMIGDQESDLIASISAGVKYNFLLSKNLTAPHNYDYKVISSLLEAEQFLRLVMKR